VVRVGRRALRSGISRIIAALSFLAIALFDVAFPFIIASAAVIGTLWTRTGRGDFLGANGHASAAGKEGARPVLDDAALTQSAPSPRRALSILLAWLPLWLAPVGLLAMALGNDHVFTQVGAFFIKMAIVTFGGAYAVLTYVAQQAVEHYHWLTPTQMLDGLGLAESTPGPLIMVVQFVGFLAAYQASGSLDPLAAGVLAASLTVWVTFVPCFLFIFLGAPYVESLRANRLLSGALSAITAAVVGVIAHLALWFTLHAFFAHVDPVVILRAVSIDLPEIASLRPELVLLTAVAALMTFILKWPLWRTLVASTSLGILITVLA
jgi:chromate transporter